MSGSVYTACKGLAYPLLAGPASCDHPKAESKGYRDGWQMLLDKHDDNEMAVFCLMLPEVLTEPQCKVLLDGLAKEYTEFEGWLDYVDACCEYPDWRPSQGTVAPHRSPS